MRGRAGLTLYALSPLLKRTGYGISWDKLVVMTWGGLRGAISLSLALLALNNAHVDTETIGSKVF